MNSHRASGRYVTVYHPVNLEPGMPEGMLVDALDQCAKQNAYARRDQLTRGWRAGGRWAVHELGPEIERDD